MSKNIPSRIRKMERERTHLLEGLLRSGALLKASLSLVKRTCGKANCHCTQEPAHPAWVLSTTSEGKRRCQVVRKADVEQVRQQVETYKEFQARLRRLKTIEEEQKRLLRGVMKNRNVPYE